MKQLKRFISFSIAFSFLLAFFVTNTFADANDAAQQAVYSYFDYLSNKQWAQIEQLIADENQKEFAAFIANTSNADNHIGYYNYASAEVVSCNLVVDSSFVDSDKCSNYSNWECWDCIVNVVAYRDTPYLKSGINRFIVYTACDSDGDYRVCEVLRIRDDAMPEDSISTFSYDAPVSAGTIGEWEMPETIRVRRVTQEDGTEHIIDEVDFKSYCYIVTAGEFGTDTYNEEARIAVALCVKQYGWNRTLVQKYSGYEYDVKDNTADQSYNLSKTPSTKVIAAVDAIWDYVMLSCDLKLFCSFHVANSNVNSHAVYHGGILSQNKANSLGKEGYTWDEILHYFYDYGDYNSEMTQGEISIVNLNHAAVGYSLFIRDNLDYHICTCTICGWKHEVSHTWVFTDGTYVCTECNLTTDIAPGIICAVNVEEDY